MEIFFRQKRDKACRGGNIETPTSTIDRYIIYKYIYDLTSRCSWEREIPLFQGNLDWWHIILWRDLPNNTFCNHQQSYVLRCAWSTLSSCRGKLRQQSRSSGLEKTWNPQTWIAWICLVGECQIITMKVTTISKHRRSDSKWKSSMLNGYSSEKHGHRNFQ